jgi:hypothetical protein
MSYHVRDVLESVQDTAPAPRTTTDDIIATARRMRARRTAAVVTGGTAAFLAVVVAAAIGLRTPAAEVPSVADSVPVSLLTLPDKFSTVLGEYRVGPYQIGPVGAVTAGYQELPVYRDGQTWDGDNGQSYPLSDGMITFYRSGGYDPDALGAEEPSGTFGAAFPVTVAGRPGIGREMSYSTSVAAGVVYAAPTVLPDRYVRTALAWQYAPRAWATYVPQLLRRTESTQDALRIAAEVTPQPARQIRMPYRLGFLPDGWQAVAVTESTTKMSDVVSEVFLHDGPLPKTKRVAKVDIRLPSVHIVVMRGQPKDEKIRGRDGVHCYSPQPACTLIVGGYFIDVDGRFSGSLSETDVRQIVLGLTPVDIADHAAWVPVDD